ncbi:MAG TPA: 5-methyltetrahydropteroyltriglutamate--homocysteine methyltransferase, partial [Dehalococcoidia bacterium]|nr:5-methyltetrahydropteroyltriglutamate--homocysteine methyltransferase [Dehalococcoidia bacterium]
MAEAFRADQIGSFLRPAQVKEARRAFGAGNIDRDQLTEIEDKAILNALERQKQTGIDIFSDGEFR